METGWSSQNESEPRAMRRTEAEGRGGTEGGHGLTINIQKNSYPIQRGKERTKTVNTSIGLDVRSVVVIHNKKRAYSSGTDEAGNLTQYKVIHLKMEKTGDGRTGGRGGHLTTDNAGKMSIKKKHYT